MADEPKSNAQVIPLSQKEEEEEKPVKRGRGRPPKAEKLKEELKERAKERIEYVKNHKLVQANQPPNEFNSAASRLILVKHQMAVEAAALEFNKYHLDLEGKDTSTVSSRIVATLQKMSEIDLEVKKLGSTIVDPRSEEVQRMAALWVNTLMETLSEMVQEKTLDAQTMDLLINRFSSSLDGWEDRVGGTD